MRVRVVGVNSTANSIRGQLLKTGMFKLVRNLPQITLHIERGDNIYNCGVDAVAGELESAIVNGISAAFQQRQFNELITLYRNTGIKRDDEIRVYVPKEGPISEAIENGVVVGMLNYVGAKMKQNKHKRNYFGWFKWPVFLLLAISLHAQVNTGTQTVIQPDGTKLHITCDTGCGGAIGAQSVNLTQVNGAAHSLTNPIFVTPATGANFSVTATGNLGRTWTLSSGTDSVNVGNFPATYDVSDRSGRLLGSIANTTFIATQTTGSNLHTVIDAGSAVIGHVINDASTAVIGHVITDSGSTTAVTGTLTDNVTQFGSTNISTGVGAAGAGIPRVTVSNDSNILATQSGNWTARVVGNAGASLDSASGAALPTNAQLISGRDSTQTGGGTAIPVFCDKSAVITATAAATVIVIPLVASKLTYICGFVVTGAGAAGTMQWKSGTGTTCGSTTTLLTGTMATAIGGTISFGTGEGTVMRDAAAAQDTCITMATASATAAGVVTYAQF